MSEQSGKKITRVGQDTVQKIKDRAEEHRLSGLISEQEKVSNNLAQQLGNAYYEAYASNPLPEFADLIMAISEAQKTTEAYREQIRKLKNKCICQACGFEMPYENVFCGRCGTVLEKPKPPLQEASSFYICNSCGAQMKQDVIFCGICGAKKTVPEAISQDVNICISCGSRILEGAMFCNVCGLQLNKNNAEHESNNKPLTEEPVPEKHIIQETFPLSQERQKVEYEPVGADADLVHACRQCGANLLPGAMFCFRCGSRNEITDDVGMNQENICPACSGAILDGAVFCNNCGYRFGNAISESGMSESATIEDSATVENSVVDEDSAVVGESAVAEDSAVDEESVNVADSVIAEESVTAADSVIAGESVTAADSVIIEERANAEVIPPEDNLSESDSIKLESDRPRFCRRCGKPLIPDAVFCLGCGERV